MWISHGCTCVPPSWTPLPPLSPPHPFGLSLALGALLLALNLHWSSVFHMVIYMFQCYSLISSHPRLFLPSAKVSYLHLCLFCCLAYRIIVTVFLNSIYTLIYCIGVSLSAYFTVYNRFQFHPPHWNWLKCVLFWPSPFL